jgi:hypothetical protein
VVVIPGAAQVRLDRQDEGIVIKRLARAAPFPASVS